MKRTKVILGSASMVLCIALGLGIYSLNSPDRNLSLDDTSKDAVTVPAEKASGDKNIDIYADYLESLKKNQEDEYKMVDGKEVELVNEPTPEPEIEYAPRYESREEAAKNPPPMPTEEQLKEADKNGGYIIDNSGSSGNTGNTGNGGSSNNNGGSSNNGNSNTGGNNGNNGNGGNDGGSNLVPPEQNPFLNPANAANNVQGTPSKSEHIPGTGDKF